MGRFFVFIKEDHPLYIIYILIIKFKKQNLIQIKLEKCNFFFLKEERIVKIADDDDCDNNNNNNRNYKYK